MSNVQEVAWPAEAESPVPEPVLVRWPSGNQIQPDGPGIDEGHAGPRVWSKVSWMPGVDSLWPLPCLPGFAPLAAT